MSTWCALASARARARDPGRWIVSASVKRSQLAVAARAPVATALFLPVQLAASRAASITQTLGNDAAISRVRSVDWSLTTMIWNETPSCETRDSIQEPRLASSLRAGMMIDTSGWSDSSAADMGESGIVGESKKKVRGQTLIAVDAPTVNADCILSCATPGSATRRLFASLHRVRRVGRLPFVLRRRRIRLRAGPFGCQVLSRRCGLSLRQLLLIEVFYDARHIGPRFIVRRHPAELFNALRPGVVGS